jgi:hypothetical protein
MHTPDEAAPFRRLRQILTQGPPGDPDREAARATMAPEFERIALSPGWPAGQRLAALADLARLTLDSQLPERERQIVLHELGRFSLRILWWEGLLGPGMVQEAAPDVAAEALVELCAGGFLPEGPAGLMVLERVRALLQRSEVVQALRANVPRRERLLRQLMAAEARLRPLEL